MVRFGFLGYYSSLLYRNLLLCSRLSTFSIFPIPHFRRTSICFLLMPLMISRFVGRHTMRDDRPYLVVRHMDDFRECFNSTWFSVMCISADVLMILIAQHGHMDDTSIWVWKKHWRRRGLLGALELSCYFTYTDLSNACSYKRARYKRRLSYILSNIWKKWCRSVLFLDEGFTFSRPLEWLQARENWMSMVKELEFETFMGSSCRFSFLGYHKRMAFCCPSSSVAIPMSVGQVGCFCENNVVCCPRCHLRSFRSLVSYYEKQDLGPQSLVPGHYRILPTSC